MIIATLHVHEDMDLTVTRLTLLATHTRVTLARHFSWQAHWQSGRGGGRGGGMKDKEGG